MAMRRVEFYVGRISTTRSHLVGQPAHTCSREEKIRSNPNKQRPATQAPQRSRKRRIALTHIIQIHGAANVKVAVSVEASYQRLALIIQIALHIEATPQISRPTRSGNTSVASKPSGEA